MSEEQKKPFRVVEQKIGFGERVSLAIQQAVGTFCIVIAGILLLPVNFIRTLFTTTRKVLEVDMKTGGFPLGGFGGHQLPDDDEDWKRAHREQYGDE
jgi:hypothetical protein